MDIDLDPRSGVAARNNKESYSALIANAERALEISRQSEEKTKLYGADVFDQTEVWFD